MGKLIGLSVWYIVAYACDVCPMSSTILKLHGNDLAMAMASHGGDGTHSAAVDGGCWWVGRDRRRRSLAMVEREELLVCVR